jgi:excinuclease ABC subunit A
MTVTEALEFFDKIPAIKRKLQTLNDVGLGYIHLGQPATTLSGGEAQRVKLSTELSKVSTGKTVYILDEPTTGLHFADISMLLNVLNQLVEKGNTVMVIEHNLDVIKTADWIIDLGPEGGDAGGTVVAQGTPEMLTRKKSSYTGQHLKKELTAWNQHIGKKASSK